MAKRSAFAAIDVGSAKIATVVGDGEGGGGESLRVLGVGVTPSAGIEKGQISDIAAAVNAMRTSLAKAEQMSGTRVLSAGVSLAGAHLACFNNRGIVAVPDRSRAISPDDVQRVIAAGRTVSLKSDRDVVHALPRYFVVDGQDRVSNPEGMYGQRLDVEMHIVTAGINAMQNLIKCVESAGVQVDDLVASPVAAASAVLGREEREEGVILLDIGGGTTDLALYHDGAIAHTASLPVGGIHVTRDLVVGLRCPYPIAEEAKATHGHAGPDGRDGDGDVTLRGFGDDQARTVSHHLLDEIIEARIEEILSMAMVAAKRAGHADVIPAGLVLTGGTAQLPGITALAERVTGLPARVGQVTEIYGLVDNVSGPAYATSLGLLRWMTEAHESGGSRNHAGLSASSGLGGLFRRMGQIGKVFLPQ